MTLVFNLWCTAKKLTINVSKYSWSCLMLMYFGAESQWMKTIAKTATCTYYVLKSDSILLTQGQHYQTLNKAASSVY